MSAWSLKQANELKRAGAILGREGLSKAAIEAVADFDGSYKGAMVLAGRLKAVAQAAKADGYWSEKVDDGYQREWNLLSDRAAAEERRTMDADNHKDAA